MSIQYRVRHSDFIKPFWDEGEKPKGVLCFQFYELNWSNGCVGACDYCYLRGTFRWSGWMGGEQTIFSNTSKMFREVELFLKVKDKPTVLHTGEVNDSLAVPDANPIMSRLVQMFGAQNKHTLLLLTKSDNVDFLLNLLHNGRTVVGFSLNPKPVVDKYEHNTAPVERRIEAMRKCGEAGYPVMARIDPMIPVDGWRELYTDLFEQVNQIPNLRGAVVGSIRAFTGLWNQLRPDLKAMLTERDVDGRRHLPRALRDEMYDLAFTKLKTRRIGVCKESGMLWSSLIKKHGARQFICNCHCQVVD
ncbi:MAG: radical SAM protein [Nitrososphaerales archaeon]